MWQCHCEADNIHPDTETTCARCGYVSPAEYERQQAAAQAGGLSDLEQQRLVGLARWLDGHLAERAGQLNPMVSAGLAAILRNAERDPGRTWATFTAAGELLDNVRGWVRDGTQPDMAALDRLLG